jgi:catalase (peroxidase I)
MIQDPEFKKYVEMYAKDQELFFKDFAKAFSKLLELGVAFFGGGQPLGTWILMEEDRWTQDLTLALVRYWAAEVSQPS